MIPGDIVKVVGSYWLSVMAPELMGTTGILQQVLTGWTRVKIGSKQILFPVEEVEVCELQDIYTRADVARMYAVSTKTIASWIHTGCFPKPETVDRRKVWTREQIEKYNTGIDKSR